MNISKTENLPEAKAKKTKSLALIYESVRVLAEGIKRKQFGDIVWNAFGQHH